MNIFRILPILSWALFLLLSCLHGTAQTPGNPTPQNTSAEAEELNIPRKDFYIYLDNSATIVNTNPDRASIQLAQMLRQALSSEAQLIHDDDTITIFTFGAVLQMVADRERAKDGNWGDAITAFQASRKGDVYTRLTDVFDSIRDVANPENTSTTKRFKVFIVASDFVHDPLDNIVANQGSIQTEVSQSIDSLVGRSGSSFGQDSFLFLLKVIPKTSSDPDYKQVFQTLSNHCIGLPQSRLGAKTRSGLSGGREFAEYVSNSLTQWVTLEFAKFISTHENYPDIELKLKNDNWFPVTLTGFGIATNPLAPPYEASVSEAVLVLPGRTQSYTLETINLPIEIKGETITLTPIQKPAPGTPAPSIEIKNVPRSHLKILKAKPFWLIGKKNVLVIETEIDIRGNEKVRQTQLDFSLVSKNEDLGPQGVLKVLDEPLSVPLSNGSGYFSQTLYFDKPNFEYENPEDYKFVVHKLDQGRVEETSKDLQSHLKYRFYYFVLGLIVIILLAVFFVPIDSSTNAIRNGFKDRLFLAGLGFLILTAAASLVYMENIQEWYARFYAIAPAYLVAALAFKLMVNKFEMRLRYFMSSSAETTSEAFIAKSFGGPMLVSLILFIVAWFLIANFVYR